MADRRAYLEPLVISLLNQVGKSYEFQLEQVAGGKNNQSYLIKSEQEKLFLKSYFVNPKDPRDRFKAEYDFLRYLTHIGIDTVSSPLACDKEHALALYTFIEGRIPSSADINDDAVAQLLRFINDINTRRFDCSEFQLANASEACFSTSQHIRGVQSRVERLKAIEPLDDLYRRAIQLVNNRLCPRWKEIVEDVIQSSAELESSPDEVLPHERRIISPSDCGFHNSIINDQGKVFFVDFEYAGWDDPAKLICDIFLQPEVPLPIENWDRVASSIASISSEIEIKRAAMLFPLFHLKWCCIMLNEFLPVGSAIRKFSDNDVSLTKRREDQLKKTESALKNIRTP